MGVRIHRAHLQLQVLSFLLSCLGSGNANYFERQVGTQRGEGQREGPDGQRARSAVFWLSRVVHTLFPV